VKRVNVLLGQCGVNMASSLTPRAHSMHPAAYHPYRYTQKSPVANGHQGGLFIVTMIVTTLCY